MPTAVFSHHVLKPRLNSFSDAFGTDKMLVSAGMVVSSFGIAPERQESCLLNGLRSRGSLFYPP